VKKHLGSHAIPQSGLTLVGDDGKIKTEPIQVLETRFLPRAKFLMTQWLIVWANLAPEDLYLHQNNVPGLLQGHHHIVVS
jgi:hypothetical protein